MANLYGVANAAGNPVYTTTAAGNISCTHDVFTGVFTSSPIVAPSPGYFYVAMWASLILQPGATVPGSLSAGLSIGAGSTLQTFGIGTNAFVPSTYIMLPLMVYTAPSQVAWQGVGSTVTLSLNPSGQNVTFINLSMVTQVLFRAPDQ